MSNLATRNEPTNIMRPLPMLVGLIKDDLEHAEQAGMEHYRAAGEKLVEARIQLKRGEWQPWLKRNFSLSMDTARIYMNFAEKTASRKTENLGFSSMNDFHRQTGSSAYRSVTTKRDWHQPVHEIIARVDIETLRKAELARADERNAQHKLALQLIDIGYKALATKLHPDKGGSREAMARLNHVRDRLKAGV